MPNGTVEKKFDWNIKFTEKLRPETVNINTVKILDEEGNIHKAKVSYDEEAHTIKLAPFKDFKEDTDYLLILGTGLRSENGGKFSIPRSVTFSIRDNNIITSKMQKYEDPSRNAKKTAAKGEKKAASATDTHKANKKEE